jgi:hypothetical protein
VVEKPFAFRSVAGDDVCRALAHKLGELGILCPALGLER